MGRSLAGKGRLKCLPFSERVVPKKRTATACLQQRRLQDTRKWKRLSNARYQISPEYSSIETAEEFIRLFAGNPDIHIVGIRQAQEVDGKTVWKPVKTVFKGSKNAE